MFGYEQHHRKVSRICTYCVSDVCYLSICYAEVLADSDSDSDDASGVVDIKNLAN